MACNCENTECLEVYLVACAANMVLPLVADATETIKMMVEFNGQWSRTDIDVTIGVAITVPNVFNESYRHQIKFFKEDGTLLNDTCYSLKTMQTIFTNPSGGSTGKVTTSLAITVDEDGNVLSVPELIGEVLHDVITKNDAVYSMEKNNIDFDDVTGEVDFTNIGGFFTGETITFLYEKTQA